MSKVLAGTWETSQTRKRNEELDEAIVAGKRVMPVERRASACKRDDANQMARTIMSKDCNRGQSAMWRRVGNRSSIWRSIHRNQCETEPRGEGERN